MNRCWLAVLFCSVALAGCESGGEAQALAESPSGQTLSPGMAVCTLAGRSTSLPDEVRETSGLAPSRLEGGILWTHNDAGNQPELFALDAAGRVVERVRITGAEAADWEDLESGECGSGTCLFIGDIGDNGAERDRITVYHLPEPAAGASESARATALHARYPDGPRDAEGLFRLPGGELYVVTKGRRGPVELYRFPTPVDAAETVTLERVRELFPEPAGEGDRVTAATASADGHWVAVRSYRNLYLYRTDDLLGSGSADPVVVDLTPLRHGQGESVAMLSDGTVWLTSEAESRDAAPAWGRLRCTLPAIDPPPTPGPGRARAPTPP